jgi:hypothetical protein
MLLLFLLFLYNATHFLRSRVYCLARTENSRFAAFSNKLLLFFFVVVVAFSSFSSTSFRLYCMMHLLSGFRPRYGSVEHEPSLSHSHGYDPNLDNSVFEDNNGGAGGAPRAMFDEDQEQQNEPPPMHRSKSALGAQSRGILHTTFICTSFTASAHLFSFFLHHPTDHYFV